MSFEAVKRYSSAILTFALNTTISKHKSLSTLMIFSLCDAGAVFLGSRGRWLGK